MPKTSALVGGWGCGSQRGQGFRGSVLPRANMAYAIRRTPGDVALLNIHGLGVLARIFIQMLLVRNIPELTKPMINFQEKKLQQARGLTDGKYGMRWGKWARQSLIVIFISCRC